MVELCVPTPKIYRILLWVQQDFSERFAFWCFNVWNWKQYCPWGKSGGCELGCRASLARKRGVIQGLPNLCALWISRTGSQPVWQLSVGGTASWLPDLFWLSGFQTFQMGKRLCLSWKFSIRKKKYLQTKKWLQENPNQRLEILETVVTCTSFQRWRSTV